MAEQWRHFVLLNERRAVFYSEKGRSMLWREFNTENETGNLTLVKMNALSVVVWGARPIDF